MTRRNGSTTVLGLFFVACTSVTSPVDTPSHPVDALEIPEIHEHDLGALPCSTVEAHGTPARFPDLFDPACWNEDLRFIAGGPRSPGSEHWRATQELCANRLEFLGFEVHRHFFGEGGVNIIGRKTGSVAEADVVMVSAHYDSVSGCPGADDNATGVAGTLEIARVLSSGSFERSLLVACWDQEELGILGSSAWLHDPLETHGTIVMSVVLDSVGFVCWAPVCQQLWPGLWQEYPAQTRWIDDQQNLGGFLAMVANGQAVSAALSAKSLASDLGLSALVFDVPQDYSQGPFIELGSDHFPFWNAGLPSVLFSDTAFFRNPRIHCVDGLDSYVSLNLEFASRVVKVAGATVLDALAPLVKEPSE